MLKKFKEFSLNESKSSVIEQLKDLVLTGEIENIELAELLAKSQKINFNKEVIPDWIELIVSKKIKLK